MDEGQTSVELQFEQLSPLLDDAVMFIAQTGLTGYESAALAQLAMARISMGSVLAILRSERCDGDLPQEERERIDDLVEKNRREDNETLLSAMQRFASGERVQ